MEQFYDAGLRFACTQCSDCCRHESGYVYLSRSDLQKLLLWSGLDKEAFINRWCRWVAIADGRTVLCLQEKSNFDCILWDGLCTAYEARPLQCSTFPFWRRNLTDAAAWEECAQKCPGINRGEPVRAEKIRELLAAYLENKPLERRDLYETGGSL